MISALFHSFDFSNCYLCLTKVKLTFSSKNRELSAMQPIHACTQFKEILRIIFGPIRMDFTEAGLTQKEES